jgi:hypothetical protein
VIRFIIPLNAFDNTQRFDVAGLKTNPLHRTLTPLFIDHINVPRINFDGLLTYTINEDRKSDGFLQLYRSGIIESVDAKSIAFQEKHNRAKIISSLTFEVRLMNSLRKYLRVLESLAVDPPLAVMLSLLDVQRHAMGMKDAFGFFNSGEPFDRDVLMSHEILIEIYLSP